MALSNLKIMEDYGLKIKTDSQNDEPRIILVKLTEKLSSIAQSLESAVIDLKLLDDLLKEKSRNINTVDPPQARKPR